MIGEALSAVHALNHRFLLDYPQEAARNLETMPSASIVALLADQPTHIATRVWQALVPDVAVAVVEHAPGELAARLLTDADPMASAAALAQLEPETRQRLLGSLDPRITRELEALLRYPEGTAGRLMDPRVSPVRAGISVADAVLRLRGLRLSGLRELFVVDDQGRLAGRVEIQDLVTADPGAALSEVTRPPVAAVQDLDPREDVVSALQQKAITELPVIALDGRFVGVIRQAALVSALEQETSVDIQTMVGASADERALSGPAFAVWKRLPWLQINLLTAFLAAAVVGLFEDLIAKVTALAVLLPVVAGQSGNAGAQALAVTMRGIVLREISPRQWPRMVAKEASVGLVNGLAVAATTALAVWLWSRSGGLVAVIATAMVISMIIAGMAGALVPMALRRFGLDPAQSSSIVLTTVTDVAGFFSFLGIATALARFIQ
jgi:magnesium transporter